MRTAVRLGAGASNGSPRRRLPGVAGESGRGPRVERGGGRREEAGHAGERKTAKAKRALRAVGGFDVGTVGGAARDAPRERRKRERFDGEPTRLGHPTG